MLGFSKWNGFFVLNQENRFVYGEFNVYDTYEVTLKVFEDDVELEMVSVEPFRSTPEILSVKSKGNIDIFINQIAMQV